VLALFALVGGLLLGCFYALFAMGLNLIFGVQRIINLAHGDVVMLGGFLTWDLYEGFHVSPILSALVALPLGIAVGFLFHRLVLPRLDRARDVETMSLVLFFGISQVIEALGAIGFGPNERSLPTNAIPSHPIRFLGETFPAYLFVVAAVAVPLLALFVLYLYRTPLGLQTRAVMADPREAQAVGINTRRIAAITFGVGTALAAAAGALAIIVLSGVQPSEGADLTIIAFAIIVFGSLGNPIGTIVAGLIFGVLSQLAQVYLPAWSNLVPYVLVLGTMLLRPEGLFGRRTRVA
jgi:branched-chain amino acid transport system permease protein